MRAIRVSMTAVVNSFILLLAFNPVTFAQSRPTIFQTTLEEPNQKKHPQRNCRRY